MAVRLPTSQAWRLLKNPTAALDVAATEAEIQIIKTGIAADQAQRAIMRAGLGPRSGRPFKGFELPTIEQLLGRTGDPRTMTHLNGQLLDIFPSTPGLQAPGTTASRVRARFGKITRKDLQADPVTGRPFIYAVDPLNVTVGLQAMPAGTIASQIDKGLDLYGQLQDGTFVPLKRRRGRRMNPANHRATARAVRRVQSAVKHAKKLFRAEKQIAKSVKKKRRR